MSALPESSHSIGHNNPPSDIDIIGENVRRVHPESIAKAERLIAEAEARIPDEINDDDTAGKVGDLVKQITAAKKDLEGIRVMEKEPFLAKSRAVDGFFKRYTERLDGIKAKAAIPLGAYKDRKDAEDRRRREEEAQRQREEAAAKLREAERLRQEAEALRREQEEEARRQEEANRLERERIQREADEKVRLERAEKERIQREAEERDRQQREEIARMKAEADKKDAERQAEIAAAEAARKAAAEASRQEAREAEERAKQAERDRREEERALRERERLAEQANKELLRDARTSERESDKLLDDAMRHDKAAAKMGAAAQGVNNRIRGEEGSVTTTSKKWVGVVANRELLDLEKLRAHLPEDALNTAVQSFVNAGGRMLHGANIFEDTIVQVR